jgi:signal transduction histidine kinase/DNA-binding response OmpR family regulator/ligand-binding sensor domain-containing protein
VAFRTIINLLGFCFIFFFLQGANGQSFIPKVEQLSIEEGLSDRFVKSIYQDDRGFMWLGCKYGLNRYDGKDIKTFTKVSHQFKDNIFIDIYALSKNYLVALHEYTWEPLPLGRNKASFSIFDPLQEKVIPFNSFFGEAAPFTEDSIQFLGGNYIIDHKGGVYQITEKEELPVELKKIEQLNKPLENYHVVGGRVFMRMLLPGEKNKNGIYEIRNDGCHLRSPIAETRAQNIEQFDFLFYAERENALYYSGNNVPKEGREGFDSVFLQHTNFLHFKSYENGKTKPFSLKGGNVQTGYYHDLNVRVIFLEKLGIYLVPSDGALELFNLNGELIMRSENILPKLSLEAFLVDDNNRVWIGMSSGVYLIDLSPQLFQQYHVEPNVDAYDTPGNKGNAMRGILKDSKRNLWFCLDRGHGSPSLLKLDPEGNYRYVKSFTEAQQSFFKDKGTCPAYQIKEGPDGMIWVTDDHYSLYKIDPQSEKVLKHYTYPEYKEIGTYTGYQSGRPFANRALYINPQNNQLLIGTNKGLAALDYEREELKELKIIEGKDDIGIVFCFYENSKGLWIGTNKGLYCYNLQTKEVKHYHPNAKDSTYYLPFNTYTHLYEEENGTFWIASGGGEGILKWNPITQKYKRYTMADGLSHNVTYAIYEGRNNELWISSNKGLMRFNKLTEQVNVFLPRDGIPHIEFNTLSHHQADDGMLYFGGLNGAVGFDPQKLNPNDAVNSSKLQITSLQYLNSRTGKKLDQTSTFYKQPKIKLNGTFQAVEIEFVLLDYFNSDENSYAYKIKDLDKDWTYSDQNRVVLRGLPYGDYKLIVKGRGKNGLWSEHILEIPIKYPKPFYLQWWFILLALGGSGLGIGLYLNWRINRLKRNKLELEAKVAERTETIAQQAEDLKELDKLKSRFFANISHELRTPLTLILGPLRQLRKKQDNGQLEVMERNGTKLLGLVEEILDLSKLEAQKLELEEKPTSIYPFFQRLFSNYESAASYKNIKWSFEAKDMDDLQLYLDRGKVEKIINNLLSNALKFTPHDGEISMKMEDRTNYIRISVEDSGEGVHPDDLKHIFDRFYQSKLPERKAQGGTGIGLALSKELTQLMGGHLFAESTFGQGSCFMLDLPKKLVFSEEIATDEALFTEEETVEMLPPTTIREGAKILVVEDHPDMQVFVQSILGEYYPVHAVDNGQAALDYLQSGAEVDLIVSDVMMPIMDGFQLLEELKGSDDFRQIPVVMLTARAALDDKLKALRIGVDDYLTKPFVAEELLVRIQNLLKNYYARQEWQDTLEDQEELETVTVATQPKDIKAAAKISQEDLLWLEELETTCKNYCANNNYSISWLAAELAISERQLRRKLKELTGLTPKKYLTMVRLQLARTLIENKKYNSIAQVMYHVGFQKSSYFSQLFKEQFGVAPSEYSKIE